MYRWTKQLPFGVMLVHGKAYESQEEAYKDFRNVKEGVAQFSLLSEEEIAENKLFKISVPLKRDNKKGE